ncbi:Conserved hypothetical protein (plasmid) [Pseudomonas veronii 1YdBTEX2]|uniref:Uncharacterized protein n=2 Tax=Pseudomonas veronii TaxID=76761 RepID=A0A1D3KAJ4_PSEVE|nr:MULTISPECIES: hypothetical protein [Pseudomonas]MBI6557393.1 hypothetical protein [Pseudomonas veronii]SBW85366.1 Conserved hypothetical protein [Pseudomonas veronii 1YdBTEX2]
MFMSELFKSISIAVLVTIVIFTTGTAHAEQAKDILFSAIKQGQASAELTGEQAIAWKKKTGSNEPILVEAKVLSRFKQPDCAKLGVKMTQAKVPKKDGGTGQLEVGWGMNLCTDGMPPAESVDWSKAPQPEVKINRVPGQ